MAKERREPTPGAAVMISRILDLMYIQMLRLWATSTESSPGSGETAKQVARRTGYRSDAAFNRAFARHHGRSPGQWRHEHVTS